MQFESFVRDHGDALARFARALVGDPALADDLVQEVLLRMYQRWGNVSTLEFPESYVRRAVVNEYLSWRRKRLRLEASPLAGYDVADETDRAEEHAVRSELAEELVRLPPRQRAVLVLRYYIGCTDSEIATILGCRGVTVRGYASRALASLRISLAEEDHVPMRSDHAI